jgi:hypothetical protein
VGLVLSIGLTGVSHTAEAASSQRSLAITIRVHNYAGVAPKTLADAEDVATEIFQEAGVETRWVDIISTRKNTQVSSSYYPALTSADIQLSILPSKMSDRLGLPNNVIGHELGHLLLNLKGHSAHGIMRGEMDFIDRHDFLLFTPQQAEVLRADVRRWNGQREVLAHGD